MALPEHQLSDKNISPSQATKEVTIVGLSKVSFMDAEELYESNLVKPEKKRRRKK